MRQSPSCSHAKVGIVPVSIGNHGHFKWQANVEERVVPSEPSRAFLRIELGHLVEDFGFVLQCDETVREFFRDVEHFRFSAESVTVMCFLKVGESGRRSAITSHIAPMVHLTNFASSWGASW